MVKNYNTFEARLFDSKYFKYKMQDINYAINFYRALCNNDIVDTTTNKEYYYSWRSAGALTASLRFKNENYLDFYCSGDEGLVNDNIREDLKFLEFEIK